MTIKMTTPKMTNARLFVGDNATNKIPVQSLLRVSASKTVSSPTTMVVERSNGFVISGREQGTNKSMAIDLRTDAAVIISIAEWVDETPAPVEVKPAPEAPTAIVYRELTSAQPRSAIGNKSEPGEFDHLLDDDLLLELRLAIGDLEDAEVLLREMEGDKSGRVWASDIDKQAASVARLGRKMDRVQEEIYRRDNGDYPESITKPEVVSAKPIASTSPALVETGERVIAVKPMALPTEFRVVGNVTYRLTLHGAVMSVEKLNPLCGAYEHEGNYASPVQVDNFLSRKRREWRIEHSDPITVKPARYSPCALTVQWQTLPLLPAPVVKPEAPRPADVRVSYKCQDITAVYGVAGADSWTVYSDGPIVRKGMYTRFHSAESAIAAAKATIDTKAAAGIRKGLRRL